VDRGGVSLVGKAASSTLGLVQFKVAWSESYPPSLLPARPVIQGLYRSARATTSGFFALHSVLNEHGKQADGAGCVAI
jgi:hypothetical protein